MFRAGLSSFTTSICSYQNKEFFITQKAMLFYSKCSNIKFNKLTSLQRILYEENKTDDNDDQPSKWIFFTI